MITGWELHLKSIDHEQFVLSDVYSSSQTLDAASNDVDFMDLSIGDRITTVARKVGNYRNLYCVVLLSVYFPSFLDSECLLPNKIKDQAECEFCGCQIGNDVVHIFRPKPGVAEESGRGWEGWIEWRLDDGTSTCKAFGSEEVSIFTCKHSTSSFSPKKRRIKR